MVQITWFGSEFDEPAEPPFVDAAVRRFAETRRIQPPDALSLIEATDDELWLQLVSVDPFRAGVRYRVRLCVYRESGVTCFDVTGVERA